MISLVQQERQTLRQPLFSKTFQDEFKELSADHRRLVGAGQNFVAFSAIVEGSIQGRFGGFGVQMAAIFAGKDTSAVRQFAKDGIGAVNKFNASAQILQVCLKTPGLITGDRRQVSGLIAGAYLESLSYGSYFSGFQGALP
jgi:hypothetical protein